MDPDPLTFPSGSIWVTLALFVCAGCVEQVSPTNSGANSTKVAPLSVTTSASGVPMLIVPGGSYQMGNETGAADEQPVHKVQLSDFLMDQYEVTQDQYAHLQLPNPAHFKHARRPVEQVRWSDAALYCNERSRAEGLAPCYDEITFDCNFEANGYRLPTEAEWEYTARSGGITATPAISSRRHELLDQNACYASNSGNQTQQVGSRRPNAWGFYDMQGNVAEWCHDVYTDTTYGESPSIDPQGPSQGSQRVLRGGSWKSSPDTCRLTARQADNPGISDACFARDTYGFRCVRRRNDAPPHSSGNDSAN